MSQQPSKLGLFRFAHADDQGLPDYWGVLSVEFNQDEGQWVGVCRELGTVAHADTLEQVEEELHEAIDLQLNEMEKIADVREYLAQNEVKILTIPMRQEAGFAVESSLVAL